MCVSIEHTKRTHANVCVFVFVYVSAHARQLLNSCSHLRHTDARRIASANQVIIGIPSTNKTLL